MQMILFHNKSDKKKVKKTLANIIELQGTPRSSCSVINPVITIELNVNTLGDYLVKNTYIVYDNENKRVTYNKPPETKIIYSIKSEVLTANYCYIAEFQRYYYISDIVAVNNNLYQIFMHVDVLMSFKDEFLKFSGYILRNQLTYDESIKDDYVPVKYNKTINEYVPTELSDSKKNFSFTTCNESLQDKCYVVNFLNKESWIWVDTVQSPAYILPTVDSIHSGGNSFAQSCITTASNIEHLRKWLVADNSLASFVLSVYNYPLNIPSIESSSTILKLGDRELSGDDPVTIWRASTQTNPYFVLSEFTIEGNQNSFLSYEPYTTYEIWLPYCSWITVQANDVLNKRLMVLYVIDYKSGSAQVSLIDNTSNKLIYTSTTQLGTPLPINSTNQQEVNANKISNGVNLGLGIASSLISTAVGVVTSNPVAVAGGVMGGAKHIGSFVNGTNNNLLRASGSVGTGNAGVYLPQKVRIRKTTYKVHAYDINFASMYGRPLNSYQPLKNLRGFTTVGEIRLDNLTYATSSEVNELDSLLKLGVIL